MSRRFQDQDQLYLRLSFATHDTRILDAFIKLDQKGRFPGPVSTRLQTGVRRYSICTFCLSTSMSVYLQLGSYFRSLSIAMLDLHPYTNMTIELTGFKGALENKSSLPKHPLSSPIIIICTPKAFAGLFHRFLPKSFPTQRSVPQVDWEST